MKLCLLCIKSYPSQIEFCLRWIEPDLLPIEPQLPRMEGHEEPLRREGGWFWLDFLQVGGAVWRMELKKMQEYNFSA